MIVKRFALAALTALLVASGAAGAQGGSGASLPGAKGSTPKGVKSVVSANNRFAFDMYSELEASEEGRNIFYSPYSISAASVLTFEGAAGRTAAELKSVLHFPKKKILRPNYAAVHNDLNTLNDSYQLKTGNALWVGKSFRLLRRYVKNIKSYYGAKAVDLNFANSGKSRRIINDYIARQTANKIKNLIPPGAINRLTRFVLTNAIYFKGSWEREFNPTYTTDQDFKITPENVIKVPMMFMPALEEPFDYVHANGLQILELPYEGERISMLILLPDTDLASIASSLNAGALEELRDQMKPTNVDSITIPKFEFRRDYRLDRVLRKLGVRTAFSRRADFSEMTDERNLSLTFAFHQAYVKVDEKGTEAAAATAVGSGTVSVRPELHFRADHPFVFIIQDKKDGNILFVGRMNDPSQT